MDAKSLYLFQYFLRPNLSSSYTKAFGYLDLVYGNSDLYLKLDFFVVDESQQEAF